LDGDRNAKLAKRMTQMGCHDRGEASGEDQPGGVSGMVSFCRAWSDWRSVLAAGIVLGAVSASPAFSGPGAKATQPQQTAAHAKPDSSDGEANERIANYRLWLMVFTGLLAVTWQRSNLVIAEG
jgi:hypothetical protein